MSINHIFSTKNGQIFFAKVTTKDETVYYLGQISFAQVINKDKTVNIQITVKNLDQDKILEVIIGGNRARAISFALLDLLKGDPL
jgi:hypothetical protein